MVLVGKSLWTRKHAQLLAQEETPEGRRLQSFEWLVRHDSAEKYSAASWSYRGWGVRTSLVGARLDFTSSHQTRLRISRQGPRRIGSLQKHKADVVAMAISFIWIETPDKYETVTRIKQGTSDVQRFIQDWGQWTGSGHIYIHTWSKRCLWRKWTHEPNQVKDDGLLVSKYQRRNKYNLKKMHNLCHFVNHLDLITTRNGACVGVS